MPMEKSRNGRLLLGRRSGGVFSVSRLGDGCREIDFPGDRVRLGIRFVGHIRNPNVDRIGLGKFFGDGDQSALVELIACS